MVLFLKFLESQIFSKVCIQFLLNPRIALLESLSICIITVAGYLKELFLKVDIVIFIQRNLAELFIAYELDGVFKLIKNADFANCCYSRYGIIFDSLWLFVISNFDFSKKVIIFCCRQWFINSCRLHENISFSY